MNCLNVRQSLKNRNLLKCYFLTLRCGTKSCTLTSMTPIKQSSSKIKEPFQALIMQIGAGDGTLTRGLILGKDAL